MAFTTAVAFERFRENQQAIASENIAAPAPLATMAASTPSGEIPNNNKITNEGTAIRANPKAASINAVTTNNCFIGSNVFLLFFDVLLRL